MSIIVRGEVQGVGFRYWAVRQAVRLGLAGHVRNLSDGSVEVVASGDEGALGELLELCRKGPSAAVVTGVSAVPCPETGAAGFTVLRDGRI